jgi:hypothetical protein
MKQDVKVISQTICNNLASVMGFYNNDTHTRACLIMTMIYTSLEK